jgi:crossover junction endodeoxyribonuclease RuvC
MTAVVGIDLSLTATGMAFVGGTADPVVDTVASHGRRADSLGDRAIRLRDIVRVVRAKASSADLIVLEGPSVMSKGGSNWDRAGLWWWVVAELDGLGYPLAVAPPSVVKKWAAGRGNADKAAVAAGMTRLWPQTEPRNDNEFDALALATMGAQKLRLPVPSRAHHRDCLSKVEWPEWVTDRDEIADEVRQERARDAAGGDHQ